MDVSVFFFLSSLWVWMVDRGKFISQPDYSVPKPGFEGLILDFFYTLWPFDLFVTEHELWTRRTRWRGLPWA